MTDFVAGVASPRLLRLQATEKELADRFFRWCERHDLTAFLVCGSALGAVRHGDMIPWDDDIDIGMLRAEFERMFTIFARDPIPGTYLQSHRNEADYPFPFAKLRLDGTSVSEPAFTSPRAHSGIFIDLFPFDALPQSAVLRHIQQIALGILNLFIMPASPAVLAATRSPVLRFTKRAFSGFRPIVPRRALTALREWWARLPGTSKGGVVDSFGMYGIRFGPETPIAVDRLVPPVRAPFGGIEAWLPQESEAYLTSLFGDFRCLPPEHMRKPGHVIAVDFGDQDGDTA